MSSGAGAKPGPSTRQRVVAVLAWLEANATPAALEAMARYAIPSDGAYGVPVGKMQAYANDALGIDQALSLALWETGGYEPRMIASYVGDAEKVTATQMDAWCRAFDNWAIVDTVCFKLFDRAPARWGRVAAWAKARGEFQRRAAFALIWSLSVHDRDASDAQFIATLPLMESAATDERHFVRKSVSMALRAVGKRNVALREQALALAKRLQGSDDAGARAIGKEAVRELARAPAKKAGRAIPNRATKSAEKASVQRASKLATEKPARRVAKVTVKPASQRAAQTPTKKAPRRTR